MNRKIPNIVKQWEESIALRSPKKMLSFYSNDAVLLATFEPIIVGKKDILEYFKIRKNTSKYKKAVKSVSFLSVL